MAQLGVLNGELIIEKAPAGMAYSGVIDDLSLVVFGGVSYECCVFFLS